LTDLLFGGKFFKNYPRGGIFMKRTKGKEGFTLIELMIVIAVIGILAAVLIPYTFRAQDRARETGVQNAARAIQTGLEMYASNQTSAPWYPNTTTTIKSLTTLVTPAPKNPFNGTEYLNNVAGNTSPFYLGGTAIGAGVIKYEADNDSYTLTLYGAQSQTLGAPLVGGR
jgi:prepilin-type N-terminal cleavage/methylation domain-containing protein